MRLVHTADLHIGYRQFTKTTKIGVNQREADVEGTLHTLVDRIIAIQPDLTIIGGDVFHVVRPSNHAVVNAFQEFERLVQSLPSKARLVLVAGNHDTPRSTETGGILGLFTSLGIHVVDKGVARIEYDDIGCSVLAIPDIPNLVRPAMTPDPKFRHNVVIMHGEVEGMLPPGSHGDRSHEIAASDLNAPQWSYIGLGHWHVYREMGANVFYSGSIDYTSSNPWGEMAEESSRGLKGKGFVERDLATGEQTFHELPVSRPHVDLETFSARDLTSDETDAAIRSAIDSVEGGIDDKVIRLVVTDVTRELSRALNQKALRDYKYRALNFALDMRRPDVTRVVIRGQARQRASLEQRLAEFLKDKPLAPDVDRTSLEAMANAYLEQTRSPDEDNESLAKILQLSLNAGDQAA